MKRSKKHQEVITDYELIKSKHLDKLATKILANDERNIKLKGKEIDPKFLNLF
jgi:hypothetical protein